MRCDDFTEWLQQRLDDRDDLEMPPEIDAHVVECDSCRGQLSAWNQISTILPVNRPAIVPINQAGRRRRRQVTALVAAMAAGVLVAFFVGRQNAPSDNVIAQADPAVSQPTEAVRDNPGAAAPISVDPASLWQEIQSRDWVAQSMPTVNSVRDSIAPMGRSLVQAMTILATGGRDQPS